MSKKKEHKINHMRKNRVLPISLVTLVSFGISVVAMFMAVGCLWFFAFYVKMNNIYERAEESTYSIANHVNNQLSKTSSFEKQVERVIQVDENDKILNTQEIKQELSNFAKLEGYEDVGIWFVGEDSPYSANGHDYMKADGFYQDFLNGQSGVYSQSNEDNHYLIYTTIWKYNENVSGVIFLVENSKLSIDGNTSASYTNSAGTYILDSDNQVVGWIGNDNIKPVDINYEDLTNSELELELTNGVNKEEDIFSDNSKTYLEDSKGFIETSKQNNDDIKLNFNEVYRLIDLNINNDSGNFINANLWIESSPGINGWRTISNQHLVFDDTLSRNSTNGKIHFSAGVYMICDKKIPIERVYSYANGALDTINGQLETQIVMFDSKIRDQRLWEKEVENTMEDALKNKEFIVYLQPKYATVTEKLSGAEALVRWISKEKGFVSPGSFIPIFEKNGFITKLDDYMLESVAKIQGDWIKEGKEVVPISVNISRIHFSNPNLADHIRDIVDKYDVPHHVIELELTESAFFDDKNILLNTVKKLKEYGFEVSMDDFGAGYSSLNSLKDLPLDIVKLDGEFFRDSDDKERGEIVVRDAISLVKNLNMRIVAEGIETKEQVEFLALHGCDLIQGYYFAKPMPIDEFQKSAFED